MSNVQLSRDHQDVLMIVHNCLQIT